MSRRLLSLVLAAALPAGAWAGGANQGPRGTQPVSGGTPATSVPPLIGQVDVAAPAAPGFSMVTAPLGSPVDPAVAAPVQPRIEIAVAATPAGMTQSASAALPAADAARLQISMVTPIAVPPTAAPAESAGDDDGPATTLEKLDDTLHPLRGHPNRLGAHIRSLAAAFHLLEEAGRADVPAGDRWASAVLKGIQGDLEFMSGQVHLPDAAVYEHVFTESGLALSEIAKHANSGATDMRRPLRLSADDSPVPVVDKELRLGFYALAGDPFQWGHLISPLRAAARYALDKVVFVLAGDEPIRKPWMTASALRHPMGVSVLEPYSPLFVHSPIASGTSFDGETNIYRLLGLNPLQRIHAFYLVGDDHYKLVDKHGLPDTLPKLEANLANRALGHNPDLHRVTAVFIEREGNRANPVPTTMPVDFLPHVGFEVASSDIRKKGMYFLMPRVAYEIARQLALYGLKP